MPTTCCHDVSNIRILLILLDSDQLSIRAKISIADSFPSTLRIWASSSPSPSPSSSSSSIERPDAGTRRAVAMPTDGGYQGFSHSAGLPAKDSRRSRSRTRNFLYLYLSYFFSDPNFRYYILSNFNPAVFD